MEAAAIKETLADPVVSGGEQADRDGAPDAVDHMHGHGADRIVDLGDVIEEFDAQDDQDAGNEADEEGTERRDTVAGCRDGDKTCERCIEGHRYVRLAIADPGEDHGDHGCDSGSQVGVDEYKRSCDSGSIGIHGNGRSAVESKPAKPEDEDTERCGRHVVARDCSCLAILIVFTDAGTQHPGAEAGDKTADHMDTGGTCKVMEAERREPAAAPDPVAADRIDNQ